MKSTLRFAAALTALVVVAGWLIAGANRGWTKTSIPRKTMDEVTGIEGIQYEKGFVPGLDFLAAGVCGAGLLFGLSFLFRQPRIKA